MRTTEINPCAMPERVHIFSDFERCESIEDLLRVMEEINRNQYQLVSVTQDSSDAYTVFFMRRYALG